MALESDLTDDSSDARELERPYGPGATQGPRAGEDFYRSVVESARDYAIMTLDLDGRILSWNPGAERLMGWSEHEMLGQLGDRLFMPEDRANDAPAKEIARALERGRAEDDRWHLRKDGGRLWAVGMMMPLRDERGEVRGLVKILRDMTRPRMVEEERQKFVDALREANERLEARVEERTRELLEANARLREEIAERQRREVEHRDTEEQLRQAQKMEAVGQLTGGVAHDFNNLLTAILGNLEILTRRLPENEERLKRAAAAAMRAASQAATLTQRLLAFSRRQPLQPRAVDAGRLVQGMQDLIHRSLGEDVELQLEVEPGLWAVEIDANGLENAILNLVINARDAMPSGGILTLSAANTVVDPASAHRLRVPAASYVRVTIADTGVGMPEAIVARAFEPFFTTKGPTHGTGLGLSQVYGFVQQSGGQIAIESAPGRGTTIALYLPRFSGVIEQADERVAPVDPLSQAARRTETVLVVEDDPEVRAYSVEAMHELGLHVLSAENADEALAILNRETRVDLLFTDVRLPGLDGPELAEKARRLNAGLKILFTTGYADSGIVRQGRVDPGVHLLNKPFTVVELGQKLREVLDGSGGRRILVVEDEPMVRLVAVDSLTALGFEVEEAGTAAEARAKLDEGRPFDAALVDVGLPDTRGDVLVPEVRAGHPELRIVIATGYAEADIAGRFAEDALISFLEKPYGPEKLAQALSRIGLEPRS